MKPIDPKDYGIRPAIIQFLLYVLNTVQGVIALLVLIVLGITNKNNIPSAFAIQGLFLMVYFATAMDIFGSFCGMIVALQIEIYHGPVVNPDYARRARSAPVVKCKCCKKSGERYPSGEVGARKHSKKRRRKKKLSHKVAPAPAPAAPHKEVHKHHKKNVKDNDELDDQSPIVDIPMNSKRQTKHLSEAENPTFLCFLCQKCFQPGKSRDFVNALGYAAWILLQLAWVLNILFTAYYTWLGYFSAKYREEAARCKVSPLTEPCYDFNATYFHLLLVVGVTFILRNIFVFFIGMGFSERYLKRCQTSNPNPNEELPSSCSDTDIDFNKVPKQILYPYILSKGRYPYVTPDMYKKNLKKPTDMSMMVQTTKRKRSKQDAKRQRRILSAHERELLKMSQGFKAIRREQVPLPATGRRRHTFIPIITGVPDMIQLPTDLMTTKARAWLSGEESDSATEPGTPKPKSQRSKIRKRKHGSMIAHQGASLILLHDPASKSNIPIDKLVQQKIETLNDRVSTEESWSDEVLLETRPGYDADADSDEAEKAETYMNMRRMEENDWADSDDEDTIRKSAQSK